MTRIGFDNEKYLREQTEEISELIINYVDRHRDIVVDKTRWLTVLY